MVDINTIREKYASMPDSEFFAFAREEGMYLTDEGKNILNSELTKRNNAGIFENTVETPISNNHIKDRLLNMETDPFLKSSVTYFFDQKEIGASNETIINGLLETGMDETDTTSFISSMNVLALQRLKKANYSKLTGGLIMMCGVAITFLPFQHSSERLAHIIAWCMIIFGAGKLINGIFNSERFKKIIAYISNDNLSKKKLNENQAE